MIKNYFKTAFRTLFKNKSYSIINITGLAVSLTASVLLLLWVWDELSYDRMHSKADRIHSVSVAIGKSKDEVWPMTSAPLGVFGKAEIPAIEDFCRVSENNGNILLQYGNKKFNESKIYVDSSFFNIFDFKLLEGNPAKPFPGSRSVVLSKTTAEKYFGTEPAMGKLLKAPNGDDYTVTGVMEDMPQNSSLQFSLMMPFSIVAEGRRNPLDADWGSVGYQTYLLLQPGANAAAVSKQLADLHRRNQQSEFLNKLSYPMLPLTKIHLYEPNGDEQGMKQVKIFIVVAIVILLIACINYVNLVTARATRRGKEVSVRKVVGASKVHLFWQFISESFVVFFISMLIAIGLIAALMPLYNSLSGKEMVLSLLDGRVWSLFGTSLLAVLVLAGVYPALMLAAFNPALALKGIISGLGRNSGFRKALVVVQFTCSVVLIVATIIISRQLEYIRSMDLGYSKENIITFNSYNFRQNYESIRLQLEQQPGILGVTTSSQRIIDVRNVTTDLEWEGKPAGLTNFVINGLSVDRTFPEVMDMELVVGKGFTGTAADSSHYLLNETAIKVMELEDPVGKPVTFYGEPGIIAGVVKDFHFKDMKTAIEPCILFMDPDWYWNTMYVKTTGNDAKKALAAVETLWKQHNADYEFNYVFMDESFDSMYKSDIRSGKLFNIFAGVAILLSCLGLFGLVTFTAETKFKEIGIRKTLGATIGNIILLISKDFLKLVGISFLVAFPLGWWMMSKWLDNYAYRTSIEWWVFALAGFAAFAIAAITVCGKSLKAAQENPIKAIRTE